MQIEKYTFIFVAINLLVLYLFLKWILFKPVTTFMEKRTNGIKDAINSADQDKAEAAKLKQQYEDQIKMAKEEVDQILDDARKRAAKEYEEAIKVSKQDAESIIAKARLEMQHERDQILKDIKDQVASLALAAASKVIEANMDTESNRALVDKFIDEAGAA